MNETEGAALTDRQRYWLEQIKACDRKNDNQRSESDGF